MAVLGAAAAAPAQTLFGGSDLWQRDTLTGDWDGLRTRMQNSGFTFAAKEQGELWGNAAGGLRPGGSANGLLTASLKVDLGTVAQWQGASLFASGFQAHGIGPTPALVGALQLISGIEATPSAKLYDLWFQQESPDAKFSLRFGQEGANDELMLSDNAGLYLNSSFGFPPLLALDLPSGGPNYPLAAPFVRVKLKPASEVTVMGAVYTSDPAPAGTGDPQLRDRHGTAFRLNDNAVGFAELWYSPKVFANFDRPGTYKIGLWGDTGSFGDPSRDAAGLSLANPQSDGIALQHTGNHGFYAVIDQTIWRKSGSKDGEGIGLFVQLMHAPDNRNLIDLFVAGGLNWTGPIPGRPSDQAGLAFTYVGLSGGARQLGRELILFNGFGLPFSPAETVIEATYLMQVAPWLSVQPDLQYVINPGAGIPTAASPAPLKNDLIYGVRATVTF